MSECLEIHARGLFPRTSAIAATARGLMGQQNRKLEIRLENIPRRASEYELSLSGMSKSAHYQKCRLNSPRPSQQGQSIMQCADRRRRRIPGDQNRSISQWAGRGWHENDRPAGTKQDGFDEALTVLLRADEVTE